MVQKLCRTNQSLKCYKRYVDDIFVICDSTEEVHDFGSLLNSSHRNLKFTTELESGGKLEFLDVALMREPDGPLTRSVHRELTWSWQYIHLKSFASMQYKRGLVKCLSPRISRICSPKRLDAEMNSIRDALSRNVYQDRFIEKYFKPQPARPISSTVQKKAVFIFLPSKGDDVDMIIRTRLTFAVNRTSNAAKPILLYTTTRLPLPPRKDAVLTTATSMCLYQFTCTCGVKYVGRTIRRLQSRISEHVPKWLNKGVDKVSQSAIAKHLKSTGHIVDICDTFRPLNRFNSKRLLAFAEAALIRLTKPALCVQKETTVNLALGWWLPPFFPPVLL